MAGSARGTWTGIGLGAVLAAVGAVLIFATGAPTWFGIGVLVLGVVLMVIFEIRREGPLVEGVREYTGRPPTRY